MCIQAFTVQAYFRSAACKYLMFVLNGQVLFPRLDSWSGVKPADFPFLFVLSRDQWPRSWFTDCRDTTSSAATWLKARLCSYYTILTVTTVIPLYYKMYHVSSSFLSHLLVWYRQEIPWSSLRSILTITVWSRGLTSHMMARSSQSTVFRFRITAYFPLVSLE